MPRILLVDDEPLVTGTLQALILGAMPDLEVQSVNSGSEALDLLDRNAYDLVVTDVSMPRISGLELLDHIRKQGSACYVIVLTAYDSFEYAYKASQYEDVRFILKIEPPEVILDAVRSGLESRRVTLRVPPADGKQSVTFGDVEIGGEELEKAFENAGKTLEEAFGTEAAAETSENAEETTAADNAA